MESQLGKDNSPTKNMKCVPMKEAFIHCVLQPAERDAVCFYYSTTIGPQGDLEHRLPEMMKRDRATPHKVSLLWVNRKFCLISHKVKAQRSNPIAIKLMGLQPTLMLQPQRRVSGPSGSQTRMAQNATDARQHPREQSVGPANMALGKILNGMNG